MNWKQRLSLKHQAMDEQIVKELDVEMSKLENRIKAYKQVAGVVLIIAGLGALFYHAWFYAALFFCTVHLQIVFNYSWKTNNGIALWKQPEQKPSSSEIGLEKPLP